MCMAAPARSSVSGRSSFIASSPFRSRTGISPRKGSSRLISPRSRSPSPAAPGPYKTAQGELTVLEEGEGQSRYTFELLLSKSK